VVSHLTGSIIWLGHARGGRARLPHWGQARNTLWLVLPGFGGGYHANHHDAPRTYTTQVRWWQIDVGGAVLRVLSACGLVSDLKQPVLNQTSPE
jgi:stearoyl-CoA desaturase (delta-9 desaturase)